MQWVSYTVLHLVITVVKFLFDRRADVVTPLMTCLTYESMLNDTFHYKCGKINFGDKVEARLKSKANGAARAKTFALNNSDVICEYIWNHLFPPMIWKSIQSPPYGMNT